MTPSSFSYRIAGWTLRSARPLPYLQPEQFGAAPADIDVHFARVPEIETPPILATGPYRIYRPTLIELETKRGLRIHIRDGRELIVDAPPDMGDGDLHTVLFGPAFAMLCHQRRCPPLHASAVVFGTDAVAIAGHQRAGKSTTARALLHRGGKLLTDDQLIVAAETAVAPSGIPSMKLWENTANWFSDALDAGARVRPGIDKFHLPSGETFHSGEATLKVVFALSPSHEIAQPLAKRLSRTEAVTMLDTLVYRSDIAAALGSRAAIFGWASKLTETVPVYHLRRPNDFARLDELASMILRIAEKHGAHRSGIAQDISNQRAEIDV